MRKHIIALFSTLCLIISSTFAQNDPVLFTVDDTPVNVSEFKYIYSKTNGAKADFSKSSLDEYLDLYVKFKLKVQRAKEMQLDTIPALMSELEGYRRQLANSYLIDKEVTEKLVKEVYYRSKQDVNISHIMITVKPNATPKDSLAAYNKILDIKKKLDAGGDFGQLAKEFSTDQSAKDNAGNIGYITSLFPNGFYPLETAAYSAKKNEVVGPVRTSAGYHLIKVNDIRDARGEMEVAHILVRFPKDKSKDQGKTKAKIDSLHKALRTGANFEDLAKSNSEDRMTAKKGGYLGFFGINRFERAFEDAAFALANDGTYSTPVESSVGWHIVKRVSKKEVEPYDIAKRRLQTLVQKDARFEAAKKAMVVRIKKEGNFKENDLALTKFKQSQTKDFLTHKWKPNPKPSDEPLFTLGGDQSFTLGDFESFCQRTARKRMRMGQNAKIEDAVNILYNDFVEDSCLKFEETQLEVKYPEFKSLMREYEEGILLFEATKILVWDKASQDTSGLKTFFNSSTKKYYYEDRADVSIYTLKAQASSMINKVKKMARKNPSSTVIEKYKEVLSVQEQVIEKGKNPVLDAMTWKVGELSGIEENKKDKSLNFMKIEKITPKREKGLKEARGYVVADYQDYLERKWIEELRDMYKVKINNDVLENLVKK